MRAMRVGNSFNEGETDLLDQLTKGVAHRGKDLSYLTRHPDFAMLASKIQAMKARFAGAPVRERTRYMQDLVLAFIRQRDNQEMCMVDLLVAHPDMTRAAAKNAIAELMTRRLIERTAKGRYRALVPSNVVQLSERKVAVR